MALIIYKEPTKYCFYKWIKSYPDSKEWKERIKECPEVKGYPAINEFYRFVKTACKNRASNWLNWDKIEKIILKEKPDFDKDELKVLKEIFEHLVNFYKTPALKSLIIETWSEAKEGNCIERGIVRGKFYEKEVPMNMPKGGVAIYDEESKEYKPF